MNLFDFSTTASSAGLRSTPGPGESSTSHWSRREPTDPELFPSGGAEVQPRLDGFMAPLFQEWSNRKCSTQLLKQLLFYYGHTSFSN